MTRQTNLSHQRKKCVLSIAPLIRMVKKLLSVIALEVKAEPPALLITVWIGIRARPPPLY